MSFKIATAKAFRALFFVGLALASLNAASNAQQINNLAPGAPGKDAQWASASKEAVGTSNTLESKVWFTLGAGVMAEVYYPRVDVANTQLLQFIVVDASGKVETEIEDTTHRIEAVDPHALIFRQTNTARSGTYTITKTYTTDPERNTVLIDVEFKARERAPRALYVYYDPSLNNSGMHDSGQVKGSSRLSAGALLASDADRASALVSSTGFMYATNGYLGTESDGLEQLRRSGDLTKTFWRATDGNVTQTARIPINDLKSGGKRFTLALGFGREAEEAQRAAELSLKKGFATARDQYGGGWYGYLQGTRRVDPKFQRQFDMAAMILKAHEDKTFRGAMIASLSIPWGGGTNANEPNVGGYHLVWARDLYEVATAFYALGDKASADRALNYLFAVQQKADGSFPQNSWLDGRPFYSGTQMDEIAFPLVLAYQLGRTDNETWIKHIKPAADFLVRNGPQTNQDRWEEKSGYSPSTIAAEIAGLVCAADIARRNHDEASEKVYLATADDWARNVEHWTATTKGVYVDKNYYLRITENNDPNDGAKIEINSGGGIYDEREIVDAGFLELVRLGIKRPDDALIVKSLAVIDKLIKVETPNGAAWYRYNHDAYGERPDGERYIGAGGVGRLWTLLAGERGEYELARGEKESARKRLAAMMSFANDGLMIPEQVWDRQSSPNAAFRFGEGTGSATPLAWAMAQFIRLAVNLEEGRNLETPAIVAARYSL